MLLFSLNKTNVYFSQVHTTMHQQIYVIICTRVTLLEVKVELEIVTDRFVKIS